MTYDHSRLRALRDKVGLSRPKLIRAAGLEISTETLRLWEAGTNQPRAEHLAALAKALGAEVQDFFKEAA